MKNMSNYVLTSDSIDCIMVCARGKKGTIYCGAGLDKKPAGLIKTHGRMGHNAGYQHQKKRRKDSGV